MARGWESKAIEEQISADETRKESAGKPQLTQAERERQTRKETLMLSRSHLLQTLSGARNKRHIEMLQQSLAEIESELSTLTPSPESARRANS